MYICLILLLEGRHYEISMYLRHVEDSLTEMPSEPEHDGQRQSFTTLKYRKNSNNSLLAKIHSLSESVMAVR